MSEPVAPEGAFSKRTAWVRNAPTPLREFLRTETGGAAVLLAATIAALAWVNIDASSYDRVWETQLSINLGDWGVDLDLRHWLNSGLMTFFFFVVGLEARREFDLGELRERGAASRCRCSPRSAGWRWPSRSTWPSTPARARRTAGASRCRPTPPSPWACWRCSGAACPTACAPSSSPWSSSTTCSRCWSSPPCTPSRSTRSRSLVAGGAVRVVLVARALRVRVGAVYFVLGAAVWVALLESGVEPVIVGLAMGLLTLAYPAERSDLDRAVERFRRFREQPTPELERSARQSLRSAISPNDRLQQLFHPWTSYVIVPLFALANAGIVINGAFLEQALTLADHDRGDRRLRGRQADRDRRRLLARGPARATGACARRWAGRRSPAAARSPGSASRWPC